MRNTALLSALGFFEFCARHGRALPFCLLACVAFFFPAWSTLSQAEGNEPRSPIQQVGRIDWTTMASTYTHDNQGSRVDQYAMGVQPVVYERPDYQRSGYRQFRSSLQGGNSADHIHIVDQWGPSVRPYGEWRYPFRPYSVPYPAWGPDLPLTSVNANFGGAFPPPQPRGFVGPGVNAFGGRGAIGNAAAQGGANQAAIGLPSGWPYSSGGYGFGPGGYYPGAYQYNPYAGGPNGFGQFGPGGGVGQYGVGPANALRSDQDEYYQSAPEPPPMRDQDFFFSPAR